MAEIDRELLLARDREGKPLPPGAILILVYLWTWVPTRCKNPCSSTSCCAVSYRQRERDQGVAPRIRVSSAQISDHFGHLDPDSVRRSLRALRSAGYALPDGERLALLDQRHRDAYLRALDPEPRAPVKPALRGPADNPVGAISDNRAGSPDAIAGISRHDCRDLTTGLSAHPLRVPMGPIGSLCGSHARTREGAPSQKNFVEIALEIARSARPPIGAAPIPATLDGVRSLVTLLAGGHDPEDIRAVLDAAPAITAAGLQEARWYGPDMFRTGVFARWRNALAQLRARDAASPRPAVDAEAETLRRARDESFRSLVSAIEHGRPLDPFAAASWERQPRWSLVAHCRPDVARAELEALRQRGELSLDALQAALARHDVTEAHVRARSGPAPEGPLAAALASALRGSEPRTSRRQDGEEREAAEERALARRADELRRAALVERAARGELDDDEVPELVRAAMTDDRVASRLEALRGAT